MRTTITAVAAMLVLLSGQAIGVAQQYGYVAPNGYLAANAAAAQPVAPQAVQPNGACNTCDPCADCPYKWSVFADFLYLRPTNAEVSVGVPVPSPIGTVALPAGPIGVINPNYEPAYRIGFARVFDECSTLGVSFTRFESEAINEMHLGAGQTIFPLTLPPAAIGAISALGTTFLDSSARQDIDFTLVDLDYRYVFSSSDRHELAWTVGARYAHLSQAFNAGYFAADPTLDEFVFSNVKFDGGGVRFGLDGERRAANSGFLVYGKSFANFVAGKFHADYVESVGTALTTDTSWKAGRVVTMLDLEVGAGWTSPTGRVRVTGGYMYSTWLNTIRTADWISSVQGNNFAALTTSSDNNLTFDGFVLRSEFRF